MSAAIKGMKGVVGVRVNFGAKEAEVDYRPKETNPKTIAEALPKVTGGKYTATVVK